MDARQEDDHRLLGDCLDGKPGAWEAFVARFRPYLTGVSRTALAGYGLPSGPQEAADAAQEVFLRLLEGDMKVLRAYRWHGSVAGYLAAVAVSQVRDRRRALRGWAPAAEPVSPSSGPAEDLARREDLDRLKDEILKLAPEARLALALQGDGAGLEKIGKVLGISRGAAGQVLSRARAALRDRLKES